MSKLISFPSRINNAAYFLVLFACCFFSLVAPVSIAQQTSENQKDTNQKLNSVKDEISKQKKDINQKHSQLSSLEKKLKANDLRIATLAKSMANTQKDIIKTQKLINKLHQEKQSLTLSKKQQESLLAKQLRTAYAAGHHDYLKLMLNQEKPAKVQRNVTYYQYLNKARTDEIEQFQATIDELLSVTLAHQEQAEKLVSIKADQKGQQTNLIASKKQRTQTIKALNKQLLDSEEKLAKLVAEEENLMLALERIAALARQEANLEGLNQLKKKLSWPVKGKMAHRFGTRKQGYLKWKGVLINAPLGKQVKTIHNGTVLFSDWLKGYGLVTVVDHGDGYMSLYGHNQALLKSVGDRVETGEPIALVGQSGGQSSAGLYFEIRKDGQAVNPKTWCK